MKPLYVTHGFKVTSSLFKLLFCFVLFELASHCVARADLRGPVPLKCWFNLLVLKHESRMVCIILWLLV